jgi:hypothetical protein
MSLVAPIRTLVNLDGELAQIHAREFTEIIRVVCAQQPKAALCKATCEKPDITAKSFTKYTYVNDVEKTWFASPLFKICIQNDEINRIKAALGAGDSDFQKIADIRNLEVRIFENTIAICLIDLDFDIGNIGEKFFEASVVEFEITKMVSKICAFVQKEYIDDILAKLKEVSSRKDLWPYSDPLLVCPESAILFDELASMRYPYWSSDVDCLMWVHRIFDVGSSSDPEIARLRELFPKFGKGDEAYATGWGNSLYFGKSGFDAFVEICCSAQLFYCLRDTLSQAQKRLHRRIVTSRERISLVEANRNYDRLDMFNIEISVELAEYRSVLAEKARGIFEKFLETFHYDDLESSVETKSTMIREKIARMTLQQSANTQRISSAAVLALGAIQVIALVHNLFWYSYTVDRAGKGDPYPGLTDVLQSASFDLALSVSLLLSSLVVLGWVFLRKGRP